jgi:hypothetical protein
LKKMKLQALGDYLTVWDGFIYIYKILVGAGIMNSDVCYYCYRI